MIDIHSHILYGVDDGAKSVDDSLEMLRIAAESGTTDIVATPHANDRYRFSAEAVQQQLAELRAAAGSTIQIHSGCDFHLSFDNIESCLEVPSKYSINGGTYLLVEFPESTIYPAIDDIFTKLRDRGLVPIITHPERNRLIRGRMRDLQLWTQHGCLVQITAQSLLGAFGDEAQKFATSLLRAGVAHFVASDAHDIVRRPPRLDSAYDFVMRKFGAECAAKLFVENPRRALQSARIGVQEPTHRKWLGLSRGA